MVFLGLSDMVDYRLLAVVIPGLCVGLPAVVWALRAQGVHRRGGGRVTPFTFCLLLSDVLEVILLLFLLLLQLNVCTMLVFPCWVWFPLAVGVRLCGMHFHQLVALEGVLAVTHPFCLERLASLLVSVPISVTLWVAAMSLYVSPISLIVNVVLCLVPLALVITNAVLTFRNPPPPPPPPLPAAASELTSSLSVRVEKRPQCFSVVALVSMVMISFPTCGLFFGVLTSIYWLYIIFFLMNLRLILDPLLCALVWREASKRQLPTHTESELQTLNR